MKFCFVVFVSLMSVGCSNFLTDQPVVQSSYFVPLIRSDSSYSGYTPSVPAKVPAVQSKKERPVYMPIEY